MKVNSLSLRGLSQIDLHLLCLHIIGSINVIHAYVSSICIWHIDSQKGSTITWNGIGLECELDWNLDWNILCLQHCILNAQYLSLCMPRALVASVLWLCYTITSRWTIFHQYYTEWLTHDILFEFIEVSTLMHCAWDTYTFGLHKSHT